MSLGLARNLGIGGLLLLMLGTALLGFHSIGDLTHTLRDTIETHNPSQINLIRLNQRLQGATDQLDAYLEYQENSDEDASDALADVERHFSLLAREAERLGWPARLDLAPVVAARRLFDLHQEESESTGRHSDTAIELLASAERSLTDARRALVKFTEKAELLHAQAGSRVLVEISSDSLTKAEAGLRRYARRAPLPLEDILDQLSASLAVLDTLSVRRGAHQAVHTLATHNEQMTRTRRAINSLGDAITRARATLFHYEEQVRYDAQTGQGREGQHLVEIRDTMRRRWGDVTLALVEVNQIVEGHGAKMQQAAIADGERRRREFLWLSAGALALGIVLSLALSVLMRARLRPLREGARMLSEGHLSYRIDDLVHDELGELSGHFDRMAERLESKEHDLVARLTDLDAANHEVRQSNAYLDGLVDSIPDALMVVDAHGCIVRANPAALALAGHNDDGLSGEPLLSILSVDPTADAGAGERVVGVEAQLVAADGESFPVSLSATLGEANAGEPGGAIVIAKDMRAAKWAERRREMKYAVARVLARADDLAAAMPGILGAIGTALDYACGSYWVWDAERELLFHRETWGGTTPELTKFLGCQRTNDPGRPGGLIRKAWNSGQFAWIDNVSVDPEFQRAPFACAARLRGALAFPMWDGASTYGVVEMFSTSTEAPEPEILEDCEAIGRQVGEFCRRKRAEEELREKSERLEQSNRELDQFAYVTSHDLKAPLRAIANLATWIEEDLGEQLTGDVQENMGLLRGRVRRMEALIQGILDYSRIGREAARPEAVDLSELLPEIIDSLGVPEGFEVNVEGKLPVLRAPRVRLTQVFSNLIGNAIKYHDRPSGRVDMRVTNGGQWYEFSVDDDGPGIPDEYHEKVFGLFQTLEARDTVESTGIGLTLVKKIVEEQGGSIRIAPHEGRGAHFRFTWPAEATA